MERFTYRFGGRIVTDWHWHTNPLQWVNVYACEISGRRAMTRNDTCCAETLTRQETQQGDIITLEEIYRCMYDILRNENRNGQNMGAFLWTYQAEPEAAEAACSSEERRRNERKHSNNYRSEKSILKAIIACLVSIYNRRSQNQLTWRQMIGLISGAIEFAYENSFAANHQEAAAQVSENQRGRCINTVEKTTRDNIGKIFNNFNRIRNYQPSDKLYVSMSQIGCAERSREDRIIILSLLMISAVNLAVLCSLTTREPHLQTMDQELSIQNIFHLCAERLDHNTYETDVPMVPDSPRADTSPSASEDAAPVATDDDEVVGPRTTVFRLRVTQQQPQSEPPSERPPDAYEAGDMSEFAHLMRRNEMYEGSTFAQDFPGLLQQQQQQVDPPQDEYENEYEPNFDNDDEEMPWSDMSE